MKEGAHAHDSDQNRWECSLAAGGWRPVSALLAVSRDCRLDVKRGELRSVALAAALKEAMRIRQTRSVRDSQLHACLADRHVTDDTLVSRTEAVGHVWARSVDRLFDLGDQFTNEPPRVATGNRNESTQPLGMAVIGVRCPARQASLATQSPTVCMAILCPF